MAANKNKEGKSAVLIILFVIFLIFASVFFAAYIMGERDKWVNVPEVKISIQSKDGMGVKNVSAKFSFKTDDKFLQGMSKEELASEIGEAMQALDYDMLVEDNGSEYVKNVIKDELCKKYGDSIDEIRIEEYLNDVRIPSRESESSKKDNELNDKLEGIGSGFKK